MQVIKPLFKNIAKQIKSDIKFAKKDIKIAVAWLTNPELFDHLISKLDCKNLSIEIILHNDPINRNAVDIDWNLFISKGGKLYLTKDAKKMHHKFYIIDDKIISTGSYNWTKSAEKYNHENIIRTKNNLYLVNEFEKTFKRLKKGVSICSDVKKATILEIRSLNNNGLHKEYLEYEKSEIARGLLKQQQPKPALLILKSIDQNNSSDTITSLISEAEGQLNQKEKVKKVFIRRKTLWNKETYYKKAEEKYSNYSLHGKTLNSLQKIRVGGSVVLAQTSKEKHNTDKSKKYYHYPNYTQLGFEKITSKETLVNQLLKNNKILLKGITLNSKEKEENNSGYLVKGRIKNRSSVPIKFTIPKGQIFENKSIKNETQNLAIATTYSFEIPPLKEQELKLDAHCMNEGLSSPDGNAGKITIFKISNPEKWNDQDSLWKYLEELSSSI